MVLTFVYVNTNYIQQLALSDVTVYNSKTMGNEQAKVSFSVEIDQWHERDRLIGISRSLRTRIAESDDDAVKSKLSRRLELVNEKVKSTIKTIKSIQRRRQELTDNPPLLYVRLLTGEEVYKSEHNY